MQPVAFAAPRLLARARTAVPPSSASRSASHPPPRPRSVMSASRSVTKPAAPSASHLPGTPYVTALCTAPDAAAADRVADAVISARVAACVSMVPSVTSVYWWDGKVVRDTETLLIMKTRASLVPKLTALVNATHPFEVPEVIVQPIVAGLRSYLDWIGETTAPAAADLPE